MSPFLRFARSLLLASVALVAADAFAQPVMVYRTGFDNPLRGVAAGGELSPALGDLDGDGDLDLVIGAASGGLAYYQNTPGGFVVTQIGLSAAPQSFARVTLGDLDADGDIDLVVGQGGFLLLYDNTGTPQAPAFGTFTTLSSSAGAGTIPALGDVDGDGDLDILARNQIYFENTGTPQAAAFTAQTGSDNPFDSFTGIITPAFADVDGDGDMDLISTGGPGWTLRFIENTGVQGAPAFTERTGAANPYDGITARRQAGTGGISTIGYSSFGDLDGDGDLDLALGAQDGTLGYLEDTQAAAGGAGSGGVETAAGLGFAADTPNSFAGANFTNSARPALADLDGDGDLDVIVGRAIKRQTGGPGTFNGIMYVYRNDPTGFVRNMGHPYDGLDPNETSRPTLADLDGNGTIELVTGAFSGFGGPFLDQQVQVKVRVYTLVAGQRTELTGAANPFDAFTFGSPVPAAGDVDGDGDADLVVRDALNTSGDSRLRLFLNTPTGFVEQVGAANPFAADTDTAAPSFGDVDGDGDPDLVVGLSSGQVFYYENTGTGFSPREEIVNSPASQGVLPAVGNLDGDPTIEAFLGNQDGTIDFVEIGPATINSVASVQLTGTAGWRMVSAPGGRASLEQLFNDPLWIQGVPGSDAPGAAASLYSWDESIQQYVIPSAMANPAIQGLGYFVYVYEDDDRSTPVVDGGFPKVLDAPSQVAASFAWSTATASGPGALSYTDDGNPLTIFDGFNMLGAPSGDSFDWDSAVLTDMDPTVYVWDPAVASYRTYTQGVGAGAVPLAGGLVAPFQAFWTQAQSTSAAFRVRPGTSNGGPFQGRTAQGVVSALTLAVRPGAGSALPEQVRGGALVAFGVENADKQYAAEDGEALEPLADAYVTLETRADGVAGPVGLSVDLRPELMERAEIPVAVAVVGVSGDQDLVLSWPDMRDIPAGWALTLVDHETGTETDLRTTSELAVTVAGAQARRGDTDVLPLPVVSARIADDTPRFTLVVASTSTAGEDGTEASFALDAPRPNPTALRADIPFTLSTAGRVSLTVHDALGRTVAVLVDGDRQPGAHRAGVDTSQLAAGVYVVRLSSASGTVARTLTVVR